MRVGNIWAVWCWQYFRILAQEGESPEIYTDPDSKVQKYRRLLAFLIVFLRLECRHI
jgi:hypothetical protein